MLAMLDALGSSLTRAKCGEGRLTLRKSLASENPLSPVVPAVLSSSSSTTTGTKVGINNYAYSVTVLA